MATRDFLNTGSDQRKVEFEELPYGNPEARDD